MFIVVTCGFLLIALIQTRYSWSSRVECSIREQSCNVICSPSYKISQQSLITFLIGESMKILILIAALTTMFSAGLKAQQTAKLQVIHNAADKAAQTVDVYVGAMKAFDNFAFQTATPFTDVPAGIPLVIGIAPGTSTSAADVLATFTVTLDANGTYQAIANGVLTPGSFASNPDGKSIGFNLFALPNARTTGERDSLADIRVFNGATDAPAVDISIEGAKKITNLGYGQYSTYLQMPEDGASGLFDNLYTLDIAPTGGETIASYYLQVLDGEAFTIIASGFLNPAANGDGSAFGLYLVTADGGPFLKFPAVNQKNVKLRIVHNAADPAAASVDVYFNGEKAFDNFAFRTSSPTYELNAGTAYEIGIAPGTSEKAADTLKSFTVTLPEGNYVVFANGVIQQNFAANPSGESIGFTIYPLAGIRDAALDTNNIDVIVFHGATDAPAVDVRVGGNNLVSALAYGKNSAYISVPAQNYVVGIAPAGGDVIASFNVPGAAIAGQSVIVFASGFLNPAANLNGEAFGLFALVGETVVQLPPATTSVNEFTENAENTIAPNPTNGMMMAHFAVPHAGPVNIRMHSVTGSLIGETRIDNAEKGSNVMPFDMSSAVPGNYIMTIDAGTYRSIIPFAVIR